jgi:hypothetical protein
LPGGTPIFTVSRQQFMKHLAKGGWGQIDFASSGGKAFCPLPGVIPKPATLGSDF